MIKRFIFIFLKVIKLISEYFGDFLSFCFYSNNGLYTKNITRLKYSILIEAHRIEKGLALPETKIFFGEKLFENLTNLINDLLKLSNLNCMEVRKVYNALSTYLNFHIKKKITPNQNQQKIFDKVSNLKKLIEENSDNLSLESSIKENNFFLKKNLDLKDYLLNRSSSRIFSDKLINKEIIENIVSIAQKAPSQCNRQSSKAHLIQNKEVIDKILSIQGGANGYSKDILNLFVISNDLSGWQGPQQRNQLYVDGALFSMMLMLGIQSENLVSCSLNLAIKNSDEKKIKALATIPDSQRLIMLVAFGYPKNKYNNIVASSPRKELEEILKLK